MTLIIKKLDGNLRGIFTDRPYESNDVVLRFQGISLNQEQTNLLPKDKQVELLQVGKDNFLDLKGENTFFINHHCNPNCYVKSVVNSAFLIADRPIAKGEEITFDFSLTSTDDLGSWSIPCNCHKYYCRKVISGFHLLPDEKKAELIKKGIVPRYIVG